MDKGRTRRPCLVPDSARADAKASSDGAARVDFGDGAHGAGEEIKRRIEALRLAFGLARDSGCPTRGTGGYPVIRSPAWPGDATVAGGDAGRKIGDSGENARVASEPEAGRSIGDIPDAREILSNHGRCLIIERPIANCQGTDTLEVGRIIEAYQVFAGRGDGARGEDSRSRLVFLDLETTGLSATPLFLAGMLFAGEGEVRSSQFLARDYSEERCLISALDESLKDCDVCVTFNGKSFDLPYLRERAKYHRLSLEAAPRQIDLLHHARRRWRHKLPNCRLLTLEWYILGRRRIGDVEGWEVPCIYHEFVHTKDARKLKHVLRHNIMDVLSMAQLFISLAEA